MLTKEEIDAIFERSLYLLKHPEENPPMTRTLWPPRKTKAKPEEPKKEE